MRSTEHYECYMKELFPSSLLSYSIGYNDLNKTRQNKNYSLGGEVYLIIFTVDDERCEGIYVVARKHLKMKKENFSIQVKILLAYKL